MEEERVAAMLSKHNVNGAVLDTNLFLLIVIGRYNPQRIESFNRTRKYTLGDFKLLETLLARLRRRIVTPNILTEVDNLSRQISDNEFPAISGVLKNLCQEQFEFYIESEAAISSELHSKIGITDSTIVSLANRDYLVITDDFPLANRLEKSGRDVINFNHIRRIL
jgi:rRNA-processing protein FCF1